MTKEELYRLTSKYLNETLSAEEKELLEQWYRQGMDEEIAINLPSESSWKNEAELKNSLLRQIKATIAEEESVAPVHRVHFLRTTWFRYAAAVILLLAGGAVVLRLAQDDKNRVQDDVAVVQNADIAPGGNRAVLTVGNRKIDLSSDKTGIAVGAAVTYTDGGEIEIPDQARYDGGGGVQDDGKSGAQDDGALRQMELKTPRGGQYQAVLPDGSRVWLNAASSIQFPSKFIGDKREIEVTGEVYLEVVKNSKQPFFVHTHKTTVQVLGTSFNINAYQDEEAEKTTLIEGKVKIVSDYYNGKQSAILKPGQQAQVEVEGKMKVKDNASMEEVVAWKNGLFSFNNADIGTLMRQVARWYDIEISYPEGKPKDKFSGEMHRDLTLSQLLKGLEVSKVRFKLDGRNLVVMP